MEKLLKRLAKAVFALLGFASCSCNTTPWEEPLDMYGPAPAEYGTPSATFRFVGKVSGEDAEGIPGIRVAVKMKASTGAYIEQNGQMVPYVWEMADTLYTDAEGAFSRDYMLFDDLEAIPESVVATAEDIDGEENGGRFEPREGISVEVSHPDEGDGRWNLGTYEARADITMTKEEDSSAGEPASE